MVDTPRKDLSLRQNHRAVHPVGAEVLDETMLDRPIILGPSHVPKGSWVTRATQIRGCSFHGFEQHREPMVHLLFQKVPGRRPLATV